MSKGMLGRHHTKETKKKLSLLFKGIKKNYIPKGAFKIGNKPWNKGIKMSEKTKKKMSLSKKGSKSYLWKGGISKIGYNDDWGNILRDKIRERDNYICQECKIHQNDLKGWNKKLDVHHIDYDKKNCNSKNLVALCRSCHIKTNQNREFWIKYFTEIV